MENLRKVWYDQNDQPPKNYIWYKNGQYLEWNGEKWVASTGINSKESINSDMTEEQKMETRKNLGLYYEETSVGEKTAKYTDEEVIYGTNVYAKISNDTPQKEDIVSFAGDTGDNLYMYDFPGVVGYSVMAASLPMAAEILVVLEESGGYEVGIYYNKMGISNKETAILVYKGQTTTISKIDAKFLPEQEDGGSSLSWLDVTGLPNDGDEVNISSIISQSDWNDLLDGKYVGVHIQAMLGIENYYTILSIVKSTQGFVYPSVILGNFSIGGFDPDRRNNIILYLIGFDVTNMSVRRVTLITEVPGPIVLTELPTTSITNQSELNAIGITSENVRKLVGGEASALCLDSGGGTIASRLNLEYASYLASDNFSLYFTDTTHKYSVVNNSDTITVTVTPR